MEPIEFLSQLAGNLEVEMTEPPVPIAPPLAKDLGACRGRRPMR
jgi:hypothetical protein